ncbi:DUF21 domain-containing protein At2g14520-like [Camellia sinensis]|uniref:DUF21 domain-containing protein At2g14520-like n=1 Tax=Camellia sinensis TaxID=4442 RepID=UPI001036EE1F|nr:DUF21 domain-containing protein At2g14520-like [Camellia sinensis]
MRRDAEKDPVTDSNASRARLLINQLLYFLQGHVHVALFRRAELKTLVDLHGNVLCEGNIGTLEEWTMEMIKLQC